MAKKKMRVDDSFVMFDVVYQDGAKSSRRKVASVDIADGDEGARTIIMDQDRKIAEMSGNDRGPIASLTRSAG
jgi:hypothetical protein